MSAPAASSPEASKRMKANRRSDTAPEVALRSALHKRGLRFRVDFSLAKLGLRARPDLVFTKQQLAVFVDGCFWHRCPEHATKPKANAAYWQAKLDANVQRDLRNNEILSKAGWSVIRIWTHEATEDAASKVERQLRSLKPST